MRASSSDSPRRRYVAVLAVFASVLFLALAIAASGVISLLTDREVLAERGAGPLIAPVMFLVATAALYLQLVTLGSRRRRGWMILSSVVVGVNCYLLFLVSGATLYSLGSGEPLRGVLFVGGNAFGPFALAILGIAVVVALCYLLLVAYRDGGGARTTPRWPWEDRDDRDREGRD
ncbi:MAG TPA: DUF6121 family protein [Lacisediminihabitans sp.]|uniref:DUF6121 family protein n=1 Tax=Lacisediminihabitans sp. TaxID=2787631 RepID=UPI002EDB4450